MGAPRKRSSGTESASACCIRSLNAPESLAVCGIPTARGKSSRSRGLFRRISRLRTFEPSRGPPQIGSRQTSNWKVRSSKWKTSEIGPTLPLRRIALPLNSRSPSRLVLANRSVSASFSASSSNTGQFLLQKSHRPRSSSQLVRRPNESQRSACPRPRSALPHSSFDRERLARLRLNHLRVDLRFSDAELENSSSSSSRGRRCHQQSLAVRALPH